MCTNQITFEYYNLANLTNSHFGLLVNPAFIGPGFLENPRFFETYRFHILGHITFQNLKILRNH